MNTKLTAVKTLVCCLAMAGMAGCTVYEPYQAPAQSTVELPPIEERPRQSPLNRNYFTLHSPRQNVVGEPQLIFASEDHTFSDIAREYGLGYDELLAANPDVDPWVPGEGTPVLLPTQYILPEGERQGIVLNIASKRLFYYPKLGENETPYVITYPIGIGRVGWDTPLGDSKIVSKAKDPTWYVPASVRREHEEAGDPLPGIVPPGPDNPLGQFVLKLDMPGYLIHGTNQPYGVGMRVSHGCVRLYPENIEVLYSLAGVGEHVTIINEPYLAGWRDGDLYFEAHMPLEDDEVSAEDRLQDVFRSVRNTSGAFIEESEQLQARAIVESASGVPLRVLKGDQQEVYERIRIVKNTVQLDPEMPTLAEVREILDEPIEAESPDAAGETSAEIEQAMNDE